MFYFETYKNKKVLRSDYLKEIDHFFTTREGFDFLSLGTQRLIKPEQTHSDNVEIVNIKDEYPNTDGLIFSEKDLTLFLRFADCTPIIFYNPKTKQCAITHAGWRGTAQKIAVKTVEKMDGNNSDIIAVIGPAIGKCCYEVSEDVKTKLLSTVKNTDNLYTNNNVDLKNINAQQLKEIGVEKIDICPYCTSCNNDLFFSYRKENGTTERHYAVVST